MSSVLHQENRPEDCGRVQMREHAECLCIVLERSKHSKTTKDKLYLYSNDNYKDNTLNTDQISFPWLHI